MTVIGICDIIYTIICQFIHTIQNIAYVCMISNDFMCIFSIESNYGSNIFHKVLLCRKITPQINTQQPRYNATRYNAISATTLFFLGSQMTLKKYLWGSADIRNSSIFTQIALENTGFI